MKLSEERLVADLTAAMKARDALRVAVLRGLLSEAKLLKVERKVPILSEADLVPLLRKEIRKREEAESFAERGGRLDVLEHNRAERRILEEYAPPPLDEGALEAAIRELAGQPGATLGGIMGVLKARWPGQYDGKRASEVARRILSRSAAADVPGT